MPTSTFRRFPDYFCRGARLTQDILVKSPFVAPPLSTTSMLLPYVLCALCSARFSFCCPTPNSRASLGFPGQCLRFLLLPTAPLNLWAVPIFLFAANPTPLNLAVPLFSYAGSHPLQRHRATVE